MFFTVVIIQLTSKLEYEDRQLKFDWLNLINKETQNFDVSWVLKLFLDMIKPYGTLKFGSLIHKFMPVKL